MKMLEKRYYAGYGFLFLIMFVSFFYFDILTTAEHGANLWDIIIKGDIFHFYEKNIINYTGDLLGKGTHECPAIYNILVYIVFAIWCLPLKIYSFITGVNSTSVDYIRNSTICLIWLKILLVLAAVYVIFILKDIMQTDHIEKERWLLTKEVFITSILGLSCILIMTRYDIFCDIFMLLALRAYSTDNNKAFILWSGIAFCFNYFSLLFYIPLLLLRRKDLKIIFKEICLFLLPMIITKLPFVFHPLRGEGALISKRLFEMLFSKDQGVFSIFLVGYTLLCFFCYVINIDEYENKLQIYSWVGSMSFYLLFGFCYCYPYWPMLLLPFTSLLIGTSDRRFDVSNLIAETIAMFGLMFSNMLVWHWCFFKTVYACNTLWKHVLVLDGMEYIKAMKFINYINTNIGFSLFHSLFVAGLAFILFVNYPFKQNFKKIFVFDTKQLCYARKFRFSCTVFVCLLPLLGLLR